jgi:DNA repair protein RecO (recombination protein O)
VRSRASSRATDEALILRRFPFGESSLVVQVQTRNHGRLSLIAKGAFRPRSSYCGVLDLFDGLELGWRTSKRSEVALLTSGTLRTRRRGITASLERYRLALSVLELTAIGGREGEADPALFDLAVRSLDLLHEGVADPPLVLIAHDLRFLSCMGLSPALLACAACGEELEGRAPPRERRRTDVPFSPGAGGRLCPGCADEVVSTGRKVERLPRGALRIAHSLRQAPPDSLARIRLEPERREQVRGFTERFLEYHLEVRPRTRRGCER